MLYSNAVEQGTLSLLKDLMRLPIMDGYNLAGGTALALQIGHRISVDIDLFGDSGLPLDMIKVEIQNEFQYSIVNESKNIIIGQVNGVKVDLVRYRYELLEDVNVIEGIRLLSLRDIASMKLAAITGIGKKRDFIDLFFLLQHFSLTKMLEDYSQKYYDGSLQLVLKSLIYFDDADADENPRLLHGYAWPDIKKNIVQHFNEYMSNK